MNADEWIEVSKKYKYNAVTHKIGEIGVPGDEYVDNDLEIKIKIFEDRMNSWFLDVANELCPAPGLHDGDHVAFMICLSYFESIAQYKFGSSKGKSRKFFEKILRECFPDLAGGARRVIWEHARNGLFHSGFPKDKIEIGNDGSSEAIKSRGSKIFINTNLFLGCVCNHFETYIAALKDQSNSSMRSDFERQWDLVWGLS